MSVNVTFWGVRGSVPCCSPEYTEYGGNTACVEIDFDGETVIIDAGTGVRALGLDLARRNVCDMTLLISHTHSDHIGGFPFFFPAFQEKSSLNIYASRLPNGQSAKDVFEMLMSAPFFPLPMHMLPSVLHFHNLEPADSFTLLNDKVNVKTYALTHPNGATGYRLDYQDKSVAYISDHEQTGKNAALADFVKDCDLMIYDAAYSPEEYEKFKGWGHSTWEQAMALAQKANVKRTALFHHAPAHTDEIMRQIEKQAQSKDSRLFAAKENTTITL